MFPVYGSFCCSYVPALFHCYFITDWFSSAGCWLLPADQKSMTVCTCWISLVERESKNKEWDSLLFSDWRIVRSHSYSYSSIYKIICSCICFRIYGSFCCSYNINGELICRYINICCAGFIHCYFITDWFSALVVDCCLQTKGNDSLYLLDIIGQERESKNKNETPYYSQIGE